MASFQHERRVSYKMCDLSRYARNQPYEAVSSVAHAHPLGQ